VRYSAVPFEEVHGTENTLNPLGRALLILTGPAQNSSALTGEQPLAEDGRAPLDSVISWDESPTLLSRLAQNGYAHLHRFAALPSRKNARWLLPRTADGERVDGFQIYAPFSRAARLMKALTVCMRATGWHGWVRHSVLIASRNPLPIEKLASEITGEREFVLSLSLGTPGTFQKLTVQVMRRDGAILGYVKIPLTNPAGERLRCEADFLKKLGNFHKLHAHIPRLLFAGCWEGINIVFQSPLNGEKGPASLTQFHEEFLDKLQSCRPVHLDGHTVVRETARQWEKVASRLGTKWQSLGREALRIATQGLSAAVIPAGIHHGDFTPWNTRMDQGRLAVFDWESARWDVPNLWDRFHFLSQTECVLRIKPAASGQAEVRAKNRSLYLLYLLSSTAQMSEENAKQYAIDYRESQLMQHLASVSAAVRN